jgi:two-component system response regulator DevR
MTETRKLRVFLCHSSQDKPIVRELYQRLNAEGWIDAWLDEEKLLPGQHWDMEIEKAVEATDAVILFLSGNSVTKEGYVQKELRFVLSIADEKPEGAVFVIPLRLDDCSIPRQLRDRQYVDYFPKGRQETVYQRIMKSLRFQAKTLSILDSVSAFESKPIIKETEIRKITKRQNKLRILLVDDHEVIVVALKSLLERGSQFEIVGSANSAGDAMEQVAKLKPDVVVMDDTLPGISGIEVCGEITKFFPSTKVIIFTSIAKDEYLFSAISAGASDYILKQSDPEALVRALEAIGRGESLLDPPTTQKMFRDVRRAENKEGEFAFAMLSQQERNVLLLVSEGKNDQEITTLLFLFENTVRFTVSSIIAKLGVKNRVEAAAYAIKHNLRNSIQ